MSLPIVTRFHCRAEGCPHPARMYKLYCEDHKALEAAPEPVEEAT